jgi:hypothetical protein
MLRRGILALAVTGLALLGGLVIFLGSTHPKARRVEDGAIGRFNFPSKSKVVDGADLGACLSSECVDVINAGVGANQGFLVSQVGALVCSENAALQSNRQAVSMPRFIRRFPLVQPFFGQIHRLGFKVWLRGPTVRNGRNDAASGAFANDFDGRTSVYLNEVDGSWYRRCSFGIPDVYTHISLCIYEHPSTTRIHLSRRLFLNAKYREVSEKATNDSQSSESPIRSVCGSDSSFPILFGMRLVVCVALCVGSIFLGYFGSCNRLCVWLGFIGLSLGLILLVVPFHWEWFLCSKQDNSEYRQQFQHGNTLTAGGEARTWQKLI